MRVQARAWNICILLAALVSACAFHILTDFFILKVPSHQIRLA
jgi:hypothetical protein